MKRCFKILFVIQFFHFVIPAKAGIQRMNNKVFAFSKLIFSRNWIPAYAGMTGKKIAGCFLLSFILLKNPASAATLKEVLDVAIQSDPILSSANYQRIATIGDKRESCGQLFPQITLNSSYVDYTQDEAGSVIGQGTTNTNGAVKGNQSSVGVTVNQSIIDLNKLAECKRWRTSVDRDAADYQIAMEDLIYRVVATYLNVLGSRTNLKSALSEVKLYEKLQKETELAYKRKVENQRTLLRVNAEYQNAVAKRIEAENDYLNATEQLNNFFDSEIPVEKLLVVKDGVLLTLVEDADPSHWADVAEQSNLTLLRSELSEKVYKYGMRAEQSKHLPTVDLFANRTDYESDLERDIALSTDSGHFATETIGVRLNWKLFSGGSDAGSVKAAKYRYYSAQKDAEAQKEFVRLNAKNASRSLKALKVKVDAASSMLEAARAEFNAVKTGSESRTKTQADLLEATLDYLDTQSSLNQARYDYVMGVLEFWRAIGSLSKESVEQIDSLFVAPRGDIIQMSGVFNKRAAAVKSESAEPIMELLKLFGDQLEGWIPQQNINLLNNGKG